MEKKVRTVCPYCGAGCNFYFIVENNQIIRCEPADGRTNQGNLCLKGYYGFDFLNDPKLLSKRITKPMIRKNGELNEVSWDEAIKFVSSKLKEIKENYGPDSIIATGCARGSGNESNYVMQKFVRAAIGSNNIDHCARV